jgi:uncharacterized membrane protein
MKYLLVAMISGCVFSLGTVILKLLISGTTLLLLLTNPMFIFVNIVFGGGGFVLSQISIKMEKASHVWLVSTASANLIIFLSSFLVLKEVITISELIGIMLMIVGTLIILVKKTK